MRIGILGGTFNPPHLGHLVCAQEAYLQLRLDRVILMPARIPPHKSVEDEPGPQHRLELCRVAIAEGDERFAVSDLEVLRQGPSYTVDTLEQLKSEKADREFFLILGGDVAAGLPRWREPERVVSLAQLAVAKRRGTEREAVEQALDELEARDRAHFFPMPEIGISSTMVRKRVGAGEPIAYLVPDRVREYIEHHRLYRGRSAA